MGEKYFYYYLIGINLLAFILNTIKIKSFKITFRKILSYLSRLVSLLGGSLGSLVSMLIFDRSPKKSNMLDIILNFSLLIIQVIILLIIKGCLQDQLDFKIWRVFKDHRIFAHYLILINAVTFIAFGLDKLFAKKSMRRIKIVSLLSLAMLGGSAGAISAMYIFRHKTRTNYFSYGLPLIILTQLLLLFFFINLRL